jgi:hypothetical protein
MSCNAEFHDKKSRLKLNLLRDFDIIFSAAKVLIGDASRGD